MTNNTSYQILIIGGGAAGITVASQLKKENQKLQNLLMKLKIL